MAKLDKIAGTGYFFWCLGCNERHRVPTSDCNDGQLCMWDFNGDILKPTFYPSVKVMQCWHNEPDKICHSFIKDGMIEYLGDCTHVFKGRTVELPEIEKYESKWY